MTNTACSDTLRFTLIFVVKLFNRLISLTEKIAGLILFPEGINSEDLNKYIFLSNDEFFCDLTPNYIGVKFSLVVWREITV